jgi:adenine-specific DNA methylase
MKNYGSRVIDESLKELNKEIHKNFMEESVIVLKPGGKIKTFFL